MSKPLITATREEVYNAPTIPWNNGTYTPISNMFIMDMIFLTAIILSILNIRAQRNFVV